METVTPRRALIVGAGPGGLTAATALRRVGIETTLFDRASALGKVGQGLGVQSNALRALMRLGVGDRVLRAGTELRAQEVHNGQGKLVFRLPRARSPVRSERRRSACSGRNCNSRSSTR